MVEQLSDLSNRELDHYYIYTEKALEALKRRLLDIQEERNRRYRVIRMLGERAGDWRGGTLAGLAVDPHYPDVLIEPSPENMAELTASASRGTQEASTHKDMRLSA